MAEKKHTFLFSTEKGEVQVSTDDLKELSSYPWFRQFFNDAYPSERSVVPERQPEPVEDDAEYIDEEELEREIELRADQKARAMVKAYRLAEQEEEERRQRGMDAEEQRPAQQGAVSLAPQQAEPVPQVATPMTPEQERRALSALTKSFLDIPPDKMSDETWFKLTKEQQREYAKRYIGNNADTMIQ